SLVTFRRRRVRWGSSTMVSGEALYVGARAWPRSPPWAVQRVSQFFDLRDARKDPGKQVIPLEDFPGNSQPLTRLFQAQTQRLHRFDAPGAFTWIICLPPRNSSFI